MTSHNHSKKEGKAKETLLRSYHDHDNSSWSRFCYGKQIVPKLELDPEKNLEAETSKKWPIDRSTSIHSIAVVFSRLNWTSYTM